MLALGARRDGQPRRTDQLGAVRGEPVDPLGGVREPGRGVATDRGGLGGVEQNGLDFLGGHGVDVHPHAVLPHDRALAVPAIRRGGDGLLQGGIDRDAHCGVTLRTARDLGRGTALQHAVGPVPSEPAGDEEADQHEAGDGPRCDATATAHRAVRSRRGHRLRCLRVRVPGSVASVPSHLPYPPVRDTTCARPKRDHSIRGLRDQTVI
jgi:hypothetical protein